MPVALAGRSVEGRVRKHLLEPVDLDDLDDLGEDNPVRRTRPSTDRPASATGTDGPATTPRYDEDVT